MEREERLVAAATRGWLTAITNAGVWFEARTPEQMDQPIIPGKNRAFYIYGHLIALHDSMAHLIGLGHRTYEFLDPVFLTVPDRAAVRYPTLPELKAYWNELHQRISDGISTFTAEVWSLPHLGISEADFQHSPWRNRFSVLLSRTNHLSMHMAQLRLTAE